MRAVIYARFSSDMQNETSIDAQIRACTGYIEQNSWLLTATYIDRAQSARSDQRSEFQNMIRDAKDKKFDALIVHKLDRFSRDRYDHAIYGHELKLAGVKLISVLEPILDSPEGVILESIVIGMSEYFSRNLGRESMKGLTEVALQCRHTGGVPPLGYDIDSDNRYVINEKEAEAVQYIFNAYAEGHTYSKIVDHLNAQNLHGKRGRPIGTSSLHSILINEKYTGVYIWNRSAEKDANGSRNGHKYKDEDQIIRIADGMPKIIDKPLWDKVQKKMKKNKTGRHKAKEPYLLSGIVYCGECGHKMTGNSRGAKSEEGITAKYYYECNNRKRTHECKNRGINRDILEESVMEYLEDLLSDQTVTAMSDWISDNSGGYMEQAKSNLKEIEKEMRKVTQDAEKVLDLILGGLDSETARERLSTAENRKLYLQSRMTDIQVNMELMRPMTKEEIVSYLRHIRGIRNLPRDEQYIIIQRYIEKVIVNPMDGDDGDKKQRNITVVTKLADALGIDAPKVGIGEDTLSLRQK